MGFMSTPDRDLPFVEKGEEPRDFNKSVLLKFRESGTKIIFSPQGP
jgi:hypothetical protein